MTLGDDGVSHVDCVTCQPLADWLFAPPPPEGKTCNDHNPLEIRAICPNISSQEQFTSVRSSRRD